MREQHDHRVGFQRRLDMAASGVQQAVDDASVLHVRRQQAERDAPDLGPGDLVALAQRTVGRGEQAVLLEIERHRPQAAQRLIVDVGEPGIDLEVAQHRQDLARGSRQDRELHVGMLGAIGRGQRRHHGQRRRDRGDAQMAAQPLLERPQFLPHGATVGHDRARPVEDAFALGGEAQETRRPLHQHHAQRILELLDARGKGRLGHATLLGRLAEIFLACKRNQKFKFIDHHPAPA